MDDVYHFPQPSLTFPPPALFPCKSPPPPPSNGVWGGWGERSGGYTTFPNLNGLPQQGKRWSKSLSRTQRRAMKRKASLNAAIMAA